jgi:hypothetical protein
MSGIMGGSMRRRRHPPLATRVIWDRTSAPVEIPAMMEAIGACATSTR